LLKSFALVQLHWMRRALLASVVLKPMHGVMRTQYFLNLGQQLLLLVLPCSKKIV